MTAAFQIVEKKDGDAGQWTRMIPLLRFLIASVLALDFACSEYAHFVSAGGYRRLFVVEGSINPLDFRPEQRPQRFPPVWTQ